MGKIITDEKEIDGLFGRYVQDVYPSRKEAKEIFASGKKLHFYLGIDPTGPHIHIGHATNLLWLKRFIALGHRGTLLVGDFTAKIGDPTGKETARKMLTEEQVKDNMKTYLDQVHTILKKDSFDVQYNSTWLATLSSKDFIDLARNVTVQQMLERDMFRKSIWHWRCPSCGEISKSPMQFSSQEAFESAVFKNNSIECSHCKKMVSYEKKDISQSPEFRTIGLQEFFYPLMQGYDSVAMKVDGEVGGRDQTFNMLVGRDMEKSLLGKGKIVITTVLLEDPKTGKKIMNKSEGNVIALDDESQEIRRKVLMLDDELIGTVFELCTEKDLVWIEKRQEDIKKGENPRAFKEELADELVRMFHGEKEVQEAHKATKVKLGKTSDIIRFLVENNLAESNSAAKQLIKSNAVKVNGKTVTEWAFQVEKGQTVKVGPGKFIEIV